MSIESISQEPWQTLVSASTDGSALVVPAITTTLPTTATKLLTAPFFPIARFIFAGDGTDTQTYNYQVVLWYTIAGGFIPVRAALGAVALGPVVDGTPIILPAAGDLFADTITNTLGASGSAPDAIPAIGHGVAVFNDADDGIATLEVDLRNATAIEVETDLTGATNATVLYQLGEGSRINAVPAIRAMDINLANAIAALVQAT